MTRYPSYRESGVEWLGEVPVGWGIVPVKAVATCNDEVLTDDTDPEWEIEYLEISGVDAFAGITETSKIPFGGAASRARRRVKDGDILVSTVRTYLRAIAQVIAPPENMIASTGFAVLRPRSVGSRFLGYLFRSEILIGKIIARSVGVSYPAINASDIMSLPIPLPPLSEQTAIAAFLDLETTKIDGLVAEQRRLIDLLREKRQAVISHAVTRGLNPHAKLKPSGIDWLGDVPEGWEVVPLKYHVSHVVDCIHTTPTYDGDLQYPAIRTADLDRGILLLEQARLVSEEVYIERIQRLKPKAGDVIYSREGERLGMAALVPEGVDLCLGQRMMMFRPLSDTAPEYLMWVLNSEPIYQQVMEKNIGSTSPHANIGDVINFVLPRPGIEEQRAIGKYLSGITAQFDTLTATAFSAIALLQERRAALISAAVTGKIDVRAATRSELEPV